MRWRVAAAVLFLLVAGAPPARANSPRATLVGTPAPTWEGVEWVANAPATGLQPSDFAGRVLVLTFFRSDRDAGMSSLAEAARRWRDAKDVAFVAIQWLGWRVERVGSVAEGRALLERHGLAVPHATHLGTKERWAWAPERRYWASELPWTVVVDRRGVVRYEGAARGLDRLRLEVEPLRAAGGDVNPLVGQPFGSMDALRWLTPEGAPLALSAQPLTLFRWWTNRCPHCTGSVPALARLEDRFRARGLRMVGVYHPKGANLGDAAAREYARRLGFAGAIAFDDRWTKYVEMRDRGGLHRATSISVLVDAEGVVRWVHPGPRVEEGSADLATLDALLDRMLPPPRGASPVE
jgi:hypothetical protein